MKRRLGIQSKDGEDFLPYYIGKEEVYGNSYEEYEKFINGVEKLVRQDPRYSRWVAFQINDKGMKHCAFLGELQSEGMELEMHHGPIFNLFDICDIVTRYYVNKDYPEIDTFFIADMVLKEHESDSIQVVSLSKMVHQTGVHGGHFFLHVKASTGRIDKFIDKYEDGLSDEHIQNAIYYLEMCKEHRDNLDGGLLEVAKHLKSFKF